MMKKILTVSLLFLLVFLFAAPAMASTTGNIAVTNNISVNINGSTNGSGVYEGAITITGASGTNKTVNFTDDSDIVAFGAAVKSGNTITVPVTVTQKVVEQSITINATGDTNNIGNYRTIILTVPAYLCADGHAWGEWEVVAAPTCTSTGEEIRECQNYHNHVSETRSIDALGHDFESDGGTVVTAPTCEDGGYTTCTCQREDCDYSEIIDEIEATGHVGETYDVITLEATCAATGLKDVYCEDCDAKLEADVEVAIDADNHAGETYDEVILAATCIAVGKMGTYCSDCDELLESGEIAIDPDTHGDTYEKVITAATCTAEGLMGVYCSDCERKLSTKAIEVDPSSHAGNTYEGVITAATCTSRGLMGIYCEDCDTKIGSERIKATGHTAGDRNTTEVSTCTGAGSWEIRCATCESLLDSGDIDMAAHTAGGQETTKAPTCTEEGEWEIRCVNCEALLDSDTIDPLGHTSGEKATTKASEYKVPGSWEIRCTVCQDVIEEGVIDALTLTGAVNAEYISIVETAKNSKVWTLTFSFTAVLSDGSSITLTESVNLNGNNANLDGKYKFAGDLEGYTLVYDIKGNGSNIKAFALTK